MSITDDEFTVLMIAAKGEYMLPIGRWKPSIEALTERGLMVGQHLNGGLQYTITRAGKAAITEREQEENKQIGQLIERSNSIAVVKKLAEEAAQKLASAAKESQAITGDSAEVALEKWTKAVVERAKDLING
jgi:hypothetical protein